METEEGFVVVSDAPTLWRSIRIKDNPEMIKDINGSTYWVFLVEVVLPSDKSWVVERRYSDFELLHQWLKVVYPASGELSFPSKHHPFAKDEDVAKNRVGPLNAYLTSLAAQESIRNTWEFHHFIGLIENMPPPGPSVQGQIYLCVCELYGLTKDWDLYWTVDICAPLTKKEKQQAVTSSTHKNRSPCHWNEEFIIPFRDHTRPIRIQLWKSRVFGAVSLGFIDLSLLNLIPDTSLNLPNTDLRVHLISNFTPYAGPSTDKGLWKIQTLKQFRVELDPQFKRKSFFPGQTFSGLLVLYVAKPMDPSFTQIELTFSGKQHTHWTRSRTETYTDSKGNICTRTVTEHHGNLKSDKFPNPRTSYSIFDNCIFKLDKTSPAFQEMMGDEKHQILPGRYRIPFQATFPTNIPPSFDTTNGGVSYSINGEIKSTKMLTFNVRTADTLTVLSDLPSLPPLAPLVLTQYGKNGPRGGEKIDMTVKLSNRRFDIGAINQNLSLYIVNNAKVPVTSLKIKIETLKAVYYEKAPRCSFDTESTHWTVIEKTIGAAANIGLPLLSGEALDTSIALEIPHKTVPSLSEFSSHLIDIQHCITVKAYAEGFKSRWFSSGNEVKMKIPIVLAHPPMLSLAPPNPNVPHPGYVAFLPFPEPEFPEYGFPANSGLQPPPFVPTGLGPPPMDSSGYGGFSGAQPGYPPQGQPGVPPYGYPAGEGFAPPPPGAPGQPGVPPYGYPAQGSYPAGEGFAPPPPPPGADGIYPAQSGVPPYGYPAQGGMPSPPPMNHPGGYPAGEGYAPPPPYGYPAGEGFAPPPPGADGTYPAQSGYGYPAQGGMPSPPPGGYAAAPPGYSGIPAPAGSVDKCGDPVYPYPEASAPPMSPYTGEKK